MDNQIEVSLLDYIKLLMKHKLLIILVSAGFVVSSAALALMMTPIFSSTVLIVPVSNNSSSGRLSGLASQFGDIAALSGISLSNGKSTKTDTALAILKSRQFTYQIINELNLLPKLYMDDWDSKTNQWNYKNKEDIPTLWKASVKFSNAVSVVPDKKTGLITLTVTWADPELSAKIANYMIMRVNDKIRLAAIAESKANLDYLYKNVGEIGNTDIKNVWYELIQVEMKSMMLANVSKEYAFKVIDPAVVPEQRISPKRTQIVLIGCIMGLFFSVLLVFAIDTFRKYKQETDV